MKGGKPATSIILVTEYFFPANNAPGARFKPIVDALISYDFDVRIYTSKISSNVKEYKVKSNNFKFPSNQKSTLNRLSQELLFGIETFMRLLFSRGHYYYITSPSFINCICAFLYCKLFNKRYIIDIRDDYPRVYFDSGLISEKGLIGKVLSYMENLIYQNSFLLVAATNGLKKNIEHICPKPVWLLRNGFSEKLFFPSEAKYDNFTIVFHGIISAYQDIDLLIRLGKEIDERNLPFTILVIGQGNQDYKLSGQIPKSIKYLGPKPYDEIPTLISKAHLGVSFRKAGKISEDSFPVKIYEYIGVQIPIISTPLSEAGAFLTTNEIGYQFNSDQCEDIINKIITLSQNNALYDTLTSNIKSIRQKFSREKNSIEFADHLKNKVNKELNL